MNPKTGIAVFLCLAAIMATGCSSLMPQTDSAMIPTQVQNLSSAVELIRLGHEADARVFLERIIEDEPLPGTTDEAIFRLTLLHLNDESGSEASTSYRLLEKLNREYPGSSWNRQAAPLKGYLTNVKNLRDRQRELKSLREHNLSLHRDNRELRQTIDRLKALDIELEQKIKR